MGITKIGIRVSLDLNGLTGPERTTWTSKRALANENCLTTIQSELKYCEEVALHAVLNAEGKNARITYTRESDGEIMPVNLEIGSAFWKDLEYARESEDVFKYLEENDYAVEA